MKLILTYQMKKLAACIAITFLLLSSVTGIAQVSAVCTNPTNTIYGLTGNGEIYPINTTTITVGSVVKNNSYSGSSPQRANGMGYNSFNGKFYYFKRNVTSSPQEFVSFEPATNTVTALATSTCSDEVHTGCVSHDGKGYYTVDVAGNLNYYNIITNTWLKITGNIVDQDNNDVDAVIRSQDAGDMAIDGYGNIFLVTSSNTNYALYKIPAPMPTSAVAKLTVERIIPPTTSTPNGSSFAGIAFKPNGEIYMSTKNGNRLYLLKTMSSLVFVGTLSVSDLGNDLTSCVFPWEVLPVIWKSFTATMKDNNSVLLNWEAGEQNNRGYYVQYSSNGTDWDNITYIPSTAEGLSTEAYSYIHINNGEGKQYYRINQVDYNGKNTYSETAAVMLTNSKSGISVWPNPSSEMIRIAGANIKTGNQSSASVFDISGKMLIKQQLQPGVTNVNISSLPNGTYLVKVQDKNGNDFHQKIIKQ